MPQPTTYCSGQKVRLVTLLRIQVQTLSNQARAAYQKAWVMLAALGIYSGYQGTIVAVGGEKRRKPAGFWWVIPDKNPDAALLLPDIVLKRSCDDLS